MLLFISVSNNVTMFSYRNSASRQVAYYLKAQGASIRNNSSNLNIIFLESIFVVCNLYYVSCFIWAVFRIGLVASAALPAGAVELYVGSV